MIDEANRDNTEAFDLQAAAKRAQRLLAPGVKDKGGDAEGEVYHPSQLDQHYSASTVILCKDIADILVRNFPDWAWAVQPDERGGVINIFNLNCHESLGYTIHGEILNDPSVRRREVIKAGGEILERFRMPHKMDREQLAEAPRDARGMLIPDLHGLNMVKEKRNAEIALKLATGEWEIVETPEGRYIRSTR
jgi:hypothetical protein